MIANLENDFRNDDPRHRLRTEALIEIYEKKSEQKYGGSDKLSVSTMFERRNNALGTSGKPVDAATE